ncbi:MAG TPA: peptide deformylase [Candidatus Aphodoplasma excrementigallinarum]|uniref:Peptide deformylase n=1 Tax=Candidatus Aphodoplasma excrementigallinarum TaxID=2840673 RepID=A0A9D1SZ06_9FIRM|nr:peptide deformylase [Candidatus Aphodoplasma excrementigallinarum]
MAIRFIREEGDDILRKKSREVTVFDERLHTLLDDMFDTMYSAEGVGLAAVQVGVLKRAIVIDTRGENEKLELINPVIVKTEGERKTAEGCLSVPGVRGYVLRPEKVTVRAKDRYGEEHEYTGEDLLAQAFCHEIEHLDGGLFIDKVVEFIEDDE